ncbi:MAG: putative toxin-antitoxin system toxin component, PIN family [Chlamydiae bacterium]|nr:putative toxin-antitoxin system toxin component, PIN family [Chlamydiota bacterium]MBI3266222.1 putative toxin-antitoxin system toxin component, PIN family [Chlamydiota bacterium]
MRIVLDTNVLVSSILTPGGTCHRVVQLLLRGDVELCVDDRICNEYREVLTRGKFSLSNQSVDDFLDALLDQALLVLPQVIPDRFLDETDRAFIEVAVTGHVEVLVTGNARHFHAAKKLGVHVRSPADFLKEWLTR